MSQMYEPANAAIKPTGGVSASDDQGGCCSSQGNASADQNVGLTDRNISLAVGALLGLVGLSKPLSVRGLACLGLGGTLIYRGMTGRCELYNALGINTNQPGWDQPSAEPSEYFERGIHVTHSVTIMKPAAELYAFWRQLSNLPHFMDHLKDVRVIDDRRSHWTAKGPLNSDIEWDAEIINDEPDKLIAWRSVGGAEVDNSGSVRFLKAPSDYGTEVHVTLDYIPPAGKAGAMIAKLLGQEPSIQIKEDLRKFKQLMESGELATNADGQPRGDCRT